MLVDEEEEGRGLLPTAEVRKLGLVGGPERLLVLMLPFRPF